MDPSKFMNVEKLSSEDLKEIDEIFAQTLREETAVPDEDATNDNLSVDYQGSDRG